MNDISAVETADDSGPPRVPTPTSSQNRLEQGVTKYKEAKPVKRMDSEFGMNEAEEEKSVIVSPKSSMISSRMAEPETADSWSTQIIEFSKKYEKLMKIAVDKYALTQKIARQQFKKTKTLEVVPLQK